MPNYHRYRLKGETNEIHTHYGLSKQLSGMPCIRGLRIPIATIAGMVAEGMPEEEILKSFPDLEHGDIREALHFAARALRERELPMVNVG